MRNEKIFITGGAGYLGKNLIKRLYKNNEITNKILMYKYIGE